MRLCIDNQHMAELKDHFAQREKETIFKQILSRLAQDTRNKLCVELSKKTTVYLMRHGQAEKPAFNEIPFSYDPDLSLQGIKQAKMAASQLSEINVLFCSPSKRTRQTADIIGQHIDKNKRIAIYLQSCGFEHRWPLPTIQNIFASPCPEAMFKKMYLADLPFLCSFCILTLSAFQAIITDRFYQGANLAIVTHGEVIEVIRNFFCTDESNFLQKFNTPKPYTYCSVTKLVFFPRKEITTREKKTIEETNHLQVSIE
jgi:broad specificity phosphatase PhoE